MQYWERKKEILQWHIPNGSYLMRRKYVLARRWQVWSSWPLRKCQTFTLQNSSSISTKLSQKTSSSKFLLKLHLRINGSRFNIVSDIKNTVIISFSQNFVCIIWRDAVTSILYNYQQVNIMLRSRKTNTYVHYLYFHIDNVTCLFFASEA